ncbi:uncharacterized protein LOC129191471 [Dunckerocampus dactyliophorus]|uniref:uncharacterized protein LOC129191471 n=1 Tax=Dunckerocampus dactyliophorus TaxID=161453 RepID=UPI002405619F|nr:uncharacterized protein LOC129191471 [Dunckerocampus dactyliophorus]
MPPPNHHTPWTSHVPRGSSNRHQNSRIRAPRDTHTTMVAQGAAPQRPQENWAPHRMENGRAHEALQAKSGKEGPRSEHHTTGPTRGTIPRWIPGHAPPPAPPPTKLQTGHRATHPLTRQGGHPGAKQTPESLGTKTSQTPSQTPSSGGRPPAPSPNRQYPNKAKTPPKNSHPTQTPKTLPPPRQTRPALHRTPPTTSQLPRKGKSHRHFGHPTSQNPRGLGPTPKPACSNAPAQPPEQLTKQICCYPPRGTAMRVGQQKFPTHTTLPSLVDNYIEAAEQKRRGWPHAPHQMIPHGSRAGGPGRTPPPEAGETEGEPVQLACF